MFAAKDSVRGIMMEDTLAVLALSQRNERSFVTRLCTYFLCQVVVSFLEQ